MASDGLPVYAAREREAKQRGMAVSALAMDLVDKASGWRQLSLHDVRP